MSQIETINNLGFFSRIIMYHLVALEKMVQIRNDKGKDLSLNQLGDLVGAMNWRLDRDIQSIQLSETGTQTPSVTEDIEENAIEIPQDMDPNVHAMDGAMLNKTEEKTSLMCLSLEYIYLGRTSFTFIDGARSDPQKNKKFLMIGDLFYALGSFTAAQTKSLPFYQLFSNQCVDTSNVVAALHNYIRQFPNRSSL